jgi:hypothetical protein
MVALLVALMVVSMVVRLVDVKAVELVVALDHKSVVLAEQRDY